MYQLHHHRSPDDLKAWETLLRITWHKGELYFLHWGCNSCVGPWRSHSYLLARNLIRTESTKFTCRLGDWSQKGLLCASSDWWGHFVPVNDITHTTSDKRYCCMHECHFSGFQFWLEWLRKAIYFMHLICFSRKAPQRPKHIWTLAGALHCTNSFIQPVTSSLLNKNWTIHEAALFISASSPAFAIGTLMVDAMNVKKPVSSERTDTWPNPQTSAPWPIFTPLPSMKLD